MKIICHLNTNSDIHHFTGVADLYLYYE